MGYKALCRAPLHLCVRRFRHQQFGDRSVRVRALNNLYVVERPLCQRACCAVNLIRHSSPETATVTKHFASSRAKRLTLQGLLAASVVGLGIAGVVTQLDRGNPVEAAQVEVKAEPVDPWVYDRLRSIRQEQALTNTDMASIGLGLDESKAVLNTLKTWVEQNREQLESKDLAVLQARRELQLAQRSVRVGPRDEEVIRSLPGLEAELSNAVTSLQNLHEDAGKSIEGQLTAGQRSAWRAAKSNLAAGVPSRYRFAVNLTEAQLMRINEAMSNRSTDPTRSKFADADQELSASQSQAVVAARANQTSNMEAVLQAEEEVLPQVLERQGDLPVVTE